MLILVLDAAGPRVLAALVRDGTVLAQAAEDAEQGHAALLPALVERLLGTAPVPDGGPDAVAATIGPGGFTGLRAALSLAQGLALGWGIPAIGVTVGEALAASVPAPVRAARAVWAVTDSKRGHWFLETFAPGDPAALAPPIPVFPADLPRPAGPVACAGGRAAALAARLLARGDAALLTDQRRPEAVGIARVGAARLAGDLAPRLAQPLYVDAPSVRPAA